MSDPSSWPAPTSSSLKSRPSAGVGATKQDNVFKKTEDAEKWAEARGLTLKLQPLVGDLSLRTLRYKGFSGETSEDFHTIGLFTQAALNELPQTDMMEVVLPVLDQVKVRQVATRVGDLGLFATDQISSGTRILCERPSIILPTILWNGGMSLSQEDLLANVFGRLSTTQHEGCSSQADTIRGLHQSKAASSCVEEAIIRSNGLHLTLDSESRPFTGVFATLSRCNHSCSPNAVLIWDVNGLTMSLFAAHTILKDAEITVAYTDILLSSEERNKRLFTSYHFKCTCSQCTLIGKERVTSDKARASLRNWMNSSNKLTFASWLEQTTDQDTRVKTATKLEKQLQDILKVIPSEQLVSLKQPRMELTDALFRITLARGDRKKLEARQKLASTSWAPYEGIDSQAMLDRTALYQQWLERPEGCRHWQCRA